LNRSSATPATSSGSRVSAQANVQKFGCVTTIERYYWWDCFHAQSAGSAWWDVYFGKNPNAWQSSGYYEGGPANTQAHAGKASPGLFDANHWNWRVIVIYTYCGRDGHLHAASNATAEPNLQWTWNEGTKSWSDPHPYSQ
jgi:hypothetical protein